MTIDEKIKELCLQKAYYKGVAVVHILKIQELIKMIIIPAIDLRQGKCVRLYQGDFSKSTQVAE